MSFKKVQTAAPKAKAIKLIEGSAAIKKELSLLLESASKLTQRMQTFLVSAAVHAHRHGDAESLLALLNNKEVRGVRMNAVKEWAVLYAPVALEGDTFKFQRSYDHKTSEKEQAIQAAISSPCWDTLKPEPKFKPFVLEDELARLLKKAEQALEDDEHKEDHKVDLVLLAKIAGLVQAA